MTIEALVDFLMNEVNAWEADQLGWKAIKEFFESDGDVDNYANKELIALADNRVCLIEERLQQILNLLRQIAGIEVPV